MPMCLKPDGAMIEAIVGALVLSPTGESQKSRPTRGSPEDASKRWVWQAAGMLRRSTDSLPSQVAQSPWHGVEMLSEPSGRQQGRQLTLT